MQEHDPASLTTLDSSRLRVTQLEAQYRATLQDTVTRQLASDPWSNLFSLNHLDTCAVRLPDGMTAEDVDVTTSVLGAAPLRSLLSGTFPIPAPEKLRAVWSGERQGLTPPNREELAQALEKLQKILAFLKALVSVLSEEKKKYEQLTQAGGTDDVDEATMSNRTEALRVIEDILYELDGRVVKPRMAGLEAMANTLSQYLAEKGGVAVQGEVAPSLPTTEQAS